MDFINHNLLTILILLPIVGAVLTIPHQMFWKQEGQIKWLTLGITLLNFLVSLAMFSKSAVTSANGFLVEQNIPWSKPINTNYHIGVDGISFWLVILTTF